MAHGEERPFVILTGAEREDVDLMRIRSSVDILSVLRPTFAFQCPFR